MKELISQRRKEIWREQGLNPDSYSHAVGQAMAVYAEEYAQSHANKDGAGGQTLYVTDKPIGDLLEMFWQRTSDACPLECTDAENQEADFKEWAESISWVISDYPQSLDVIAEYIEYDRLMTNVNQKDWNALPDGGKIALFKNYKKPKPPQI